MTTALHAGAVVRGKRPIIVIAAMLACLLPGKPGQAQPAAPVGPDIPVAFMLDLQSGKTLFAREPRRRFVPASVTKVMTAFTLFEMIEEGDLSLRRRLQVSQQIADEWSGQGSSMFVKAGERITVNDLMLGLTTVSANDGAMVLATEIAGSPEKWFERMNTAAARLGMNDSHFSTPNGYPDGGQTFTTATDLAILAEATIERYPNLYTKFFGHRSFTYGGRTQVNHDPITGVVPGADGIKTGFTREAGYNFLGSAQRSGRRLVMVLAGADTGQLRNSTARAFMNWGFDNFSNTLLFSKGAFLAEARVQDGAESNVPLRAPRDIYVTRAAGSDAEVTLELRYTGPLQAPVTEGAAVARLRISVEGEQPYEVPLEAGASVAQANSFRRIFNGLAGLFA